MARKPIQGGSSGQANLAPVSPETYSQDYFLSECDGHREFARSCGVRLPIRLAVSADLASVGEGHAVLDLGCGRGEMVHHCVSRGAWASGVDYSAVALRLARNGLAETPEDERARASLLQADAKHLPFADHSFDRALMLDIVEHLHPWELHEALCEVRRVLKPDGVLLVHTMPNLWYYRFGYPLYRLAARLMGRKLPEDPRKRWRYVSDVHVNEQDVVRLTRAMRAAGFRTTAWLQHVGSDDPEDSILIRLARAVLARLYPFKLVFCNDIFARGWPETATSVVSSPAASDPPRNVQQARESGSTEDVK